MSARVAESVFLLLTAVSAWLNSAPAHAADVELRDGDHVVTLGGTFVEREGQFGDIETAVTAAFPDRNITFRNLGWSGDTVWAESRGIFDPAAAGYQRMIDLVKELKPTVIVLAYGQNESFAGQAGLEAFIKQYEKLCDDLAPTQARLVFLTPLPLHSPEPAVPSLAKTNQNVELYATAIRELAAKRGSLIDIGKTARDALQSASDSSLTTWFDGIHLSPEGNRQAAGWFCRAAGLPTPPDLELEPYQALRRQIVDKNTLFFHRWRPQNVTYLFLFRKHEQGNNAVDIPRFDELTQAADAKVAELRTKLPRP